MKKNPNKLLFKKTAILFLMMALFVACDKDDDKCQGIDCLPPATQTGAGTFGCLVNGVPFVDNSGFFNCFYQLVNGEYYFSISAENTNLIPRNIRISANALELVGNNTYQFYSPSNGNFHAAVIFYYNGVHPNENSTNVQNSGSIVITKLDFENNIISGTFNFNVRDTINNKTYIITEGRFDSFFTQ
jgi:hypothetical protein